MFATAQAAESPYARVRPSETSEIVARAIEALREVVTVEPLALDDVARWCAAFGGVDPRLERAALAHALTLVSIDVLVEDLADSLRARLLAAGPLLPALIASGGVPLVLSTLGLDDVEPPPHALARAVPPRVARFYWQRLRAFATWTVSFTWSMDA